MSNVYREPSSQIEYEENAAPLERGPIRDLARAVDIDVGYDHHFLPGDHHWHAARCAVNTVSAMILYVAYRACVNTYWLQPEPIPEDALRAANTLAKACFDILCEVP